MTDTFDRRLGVPPTPTFCRWHITVLLLELVALFLFSAYVTTCKSLPVEVLPFGSNKSH